MNIDDEWLAFLNRDSCSDESFKETCKAVDFGNDNTRMSCHPTGIETANNTTNEYNEGTTSCGTKLCTTEPHHEGSTFSNTSPEPSELYISTKTKIVYLSHTIDLLDVFWNIPVIKYGTRSNGVIKKQIKIHSSSQEEMDDILRKVQEYVDDGFYVEQQNLKAVNTNTQQCPNKFKDVRKVSIGLCRKDILTQRTKQKSAFYNCFVVIMRVLYQNVYRDVHVKVFNTGKMEIPGMPDDNLFTCVLQEIIKLLQPYYDETLIFQTEKCETVLINSNFYTGFHINRDKLFDILKYTYQINASYDPCSYPGIQCKYNTQLSFMIFRTGSVLIVGKSCDEELNTVYEFLKTLLMKHHDTICERNEYGSQDIAPKTKKEIKVVKIRKRSFMKNMVTNSLTPK